MACLLLWFIAGALLGYLLKSLDILNERQIAVLCVMWPIGGIVPIFIIT
ncbi:hypothetical protein HNQ64_001032 [Prosthecobacter dejongeii]|uniref:Uncharacterized protein n=1 Tax=Prosthecobacter dejongeii TaxID=48465 RepID=A0A7W8DNW4_9BACT|nr:hypothetical protein [Prosthecobacter dejongeii]